MKKDDGKRHKTVKFERSDLVTLIAVKAEVTSLRTELRELVDTLNQRIDAVSKVTTAYNDAIVKQMATFTELMGEIAPLVRDHRTYFRITSWVLGAGLLSSILRWFF